MKARLTLSKALLVGALASCSGGAKPVTDTTTTTTTTTDDGASQGSELSAVERFRQECMQGLTQAKAELRGLLSTGGLRTEENLLVPYNQLLLHVEQSAGTAGLMKEVHPDAGVREVAQECEQEVSAFLSELSLNRELYDVFAKLSTEGLDANTKRWVDKIMRDFRRAGVDRDPATRERLQQIDKELVTHGQAFSANISSDRRTIELDSAAELAGLPPDYVAAHAPNDAGKVVISTDYPDYMPFMLYADKGEHRKALYTEFKSRAKEVNESELREILKLRAEKARLLGYANWADYITEDKMMESGKKASDFIARVNKVATKRAKQDYADLLAFKRKHIDKKAKSVEDWEKTYIENKVKAERFSFDSQEVRAYFDYKAVEAGLLDITAKLFDVQYEPVAAADADLWHEDVTAYDVKRGDELLGRIYLDMHPRDNKYKHAAQFPYRSGSLGLQKPEGVLVCNFPNPKGSPDGHALMSHDEVSTMFHEFGHLMHHVIGGQQRWIAQSGVATEWDFVEAPSQMLEEWARSHETLSAFAKHYETGAVIPKELVDKLVRAEKFGLGLQVVQQLFYASISLEFHRADPEKLDMLAKVQDLQKEFTPFPYVENTAFHTSFGHLEGYSALYYTYMWSLVLAKDLFTPFAKNGLMSTTWTYKYRDSVLAPGGTKDAAELVSDFLGRPYSFDAFEAYLSR